MQALVKTARGEGNVLVQEVERPALGGEDWVLIQVKAGGICGTDIHVWQDKFMYWPPVILGHEFSGVVVEAGRRCTRFGVGDRVVAEPGVRMCGKCAYCRSGRGHMCADKLTLGWRTDGIFAQYVALPESILHRIPNTLGYEIAALCEPVAIAVSAVAERGKINVGEFVVVLGSGPVGILCAFLAKTLGARKVLMTGLGASECCRFDVAQRLGVDYLINVEREDARKAVMKFNSGSGADCIIETSGSPAAIAQSVDMVIKGGRIIALGIPAVEQISYPWSAAVLNSIAVYFNMSSSYTSWDSALSILENHQEQLSNLITWTGTITKWEQAFQSLVAEKDVKSVFTF